MADVVAGTLQNVDDQLPRPVPAQAWAEAPAPRAPSKPRSNSERPAAVRWLRHAVRKLCGGRPHSIRRPCGLRAAGPPTSRALGESSAAGVKPLLHHGAAGRLPASPPELPRAGPAGSEGACDQTSGATSTAGSSDGSPEPPRAGARLPRPDLAAAEDEWAPRSCGLPWLRQPGAPTSLTLGELRPGRRASGRLASEPRTLGDLPELQGSGAEVRTGLGYRASGRRVGEPHTFGDLPELQGSGLWRESRGSPGRPRLGPARGRFAHAARAGRYAAGRPRRSRQHVRRASVGFRCARAGLQRRGDPSWAAPVPQRASGAPAPARGAARQRSEVAVGKGPRAPALRSQLRPGLGWPGRRAAGRGSRGPRRRRLPARAPRGERRRRPVPQARAEAACGLRVCPRKASSARATRTQSLWRQGARGVPMPLPAVLASRFALPAGRGPPRLRLLFCRGPHFGFCQGGALAIAPSVRVQAIF
ncbi:unnamed protein product [Prorocentrum cordatum]|uniref:Uncharacterized protein n=1 Tax=Prorocentrum cordatum TaxID=2364126 RepID=A0ABN9P8F5_9DINO|nr:unnamed protein product [Polarella glacialis]